MKVLIHILIAILLFHITSFSQTTNKNYNKLKNGNNILIKEYEDTLSLLLDSINNAKFDSNKYAANESFIKNLKEVLTYKISYEYPFNLLKISKIRAGDDSFRIFNWFIKKSNGSFDYYAIMHLYNKKNNKLDIVEFINKPKKPRNINQAETNHENWFGCLYYDIIYIKKQGRSFYTLLGWDGNDDYSRKKIIDVLYFKNKEIKFGLPVFKRGKEVLKRIILEYDAKTLISLKYHKESKEIIFNNLIPPKKELIGMEEYYIPDGNFNSYTYKQGKWWFNENVDIRNSQKTKKIKKPKMGLIPN